jgi:hypothetical protein
MGSGYSQRIFTKAEAERYVKYLCCWGHNHTTNDLPQRDPQEYRAALLQLITVNKTRDDDIGRWETQAALRELQKLGK